MLSFNTITLTLIGALSLIVLFSNIVLSVLSVPYLVSLAVIGMRDLTLVALCIMLPLFLPKQKRNPFLWLLILLFIATSGIVLFQSLFFETAASKVQTLAIFRVVFAFPILVISFCLICNFKHLKTGDKKQATKFESFIKLFVFICFIEFLAMVLGLHHSYLSLINYHEFMASKGVSAGIAFGLFDLRLTTPIFNPSVGGLLLAIFFGFFLERRQYRWALLSVIPLILTVSKTGWIFAFIFVAFKKFNPTAGFMLSIIAYCSAVFLFQFLDFEKIGRIIDVDEFALHMGSVESHFNGLVSGLSYFFHPLGLGNAGTIPGVNFAEKVGRESGVGVGLASIGFVYLILVSLSFYALGSHYKRVGYLLGSMYLLTALMSEGPATYYIWLPVFMLFLNTYVPK